MEIAIAFFRVKPRIGIYYFLTFEMFPEAEKISLFQSIFIICLERVMHYKKTGEKMIPASSVIGEKDLTGYTVVVTG